MQEIVKVGVLVVGLSFVAALPSTAATLSTGLEAWYPFNGNANDESGNGNDGAVSNATLTSDRNGASSSAYAFNGTNSAIDIGAGVKPALPHTINLWFRTDAEGFTPLFRNDTVDGGSFRHGSFLSLRDDRAIGLQHFSGFALESTRYGIFTNPEVYEFSQWTMVTAITGTPGMPRLFVNGVEANYSTSPGTGTGFTYSGASGAIGQVAPTQNNISVFERTSFRGEIDDVGVWNRALTEEEITMLFNGVDPLKSVTMSPVPLPASLPILVAGLGVFVILSRAHPKSC